VSDKEPIRFMRQRHIDAMQVIEDAEIRARRRTKWIVVAVFVAACLAMAVVAVIRS
jgi:hypothetical protein